MSASSNNLGTEITSNKPCEDQNNLTLLHQAAATGMLDIVHALLNTGLDPNNQNENGSTPLHLAAKAKNLEIVEVLLDFGADPNIRDYLNRTPIYVVSNEKHDVSKIVLALLKKKAHINIHDKFGSTPLQEAVSGNLINVLTLLDNGADSNIQNEHGETTLHYLAESCDLKMISVLLKYKADVHIQDTSGYTPLYNAIMDNFTDGALAILEHTTNVNIRDNEGKTPIFYATREDNEKVVSALLERNADVHIKDKTNLTPLGSAVIGGNSKIVSMLLDRNVEVNTCDDEGDTPLHFAASSNAKILQMLIDKNAKVNVQNEKGETPLYLAVGNKQNLIILIENGANVNMLDKEEISAGYIEREDFPENFFLREHILKLYAAGFEICSKNYQSVYDDSDYEDDTVSRAANKFYCKCTEELNKMKSEVIPNSSITFHKFMTANKRIRANYLNNDSITKAIRSDELTKKFPLYVHILRSRLTTALKRHKLMKQLRVYRDSRIFQRLPEVCIDEICSYLSIHELQKLNFVLQLAALSDR